MNGDFVACSKLICFVSNALWAHFRNPNRTSVAQVIFYAAFFVVESEMRIHLNLSAEDLSIVERGSIDGKLYYQIY